MSRGRKEERARKTDGGFGCKKKLRNRGRIRRRGDAGESVREGKRSGLKKKDQLNIESIDLLGGPVIRFADRYRVEGNTLRGAFTRSRWLTGFVRFCRKGYQGA